MPDWRTRVALSRLDATYLDNFLTCGPPPCTAPNLPVPAGNRIAGTQKASGYAELAWAGGRFGDWGLEVRGASSTAVNDLNSDFAGGYGTASLRFAYKLPLGTAQRVELLARADNVFDRRYAGSVIVNEANSRYFETGVPRSFLIALRVIGGL
jgi:iron complex outermembrane receptor protein